MEVVRATKLWQRAAAYYVRIESMVKGFDIPVDVEFDEHDTENTKYVVVFDGNLPVANCRLFKVDDDTAKIERVSVILAYRKKGVGRMLIEGAEEWIREENYKKIIISSRDEAVGFYEKLGYKADYDRVDGSGFFKCIYTEKIL